MTNTIAHWINNKLYAGTGGTTSPVTNPATGEVTGRWRWPVWRMPAR